jgi:hypothetical protein
LVHHVEFFFGFNGGHATVIGDEDLRGHVFWIDGNGSRENVELAHLMDLKIHHEVFATCIDRR